MATSNSWQRVPAQLEASEWAGMATDAAFTSQSVLSEKRLFDLVVAALGVVLLSPVLALIALAVKLDSRGPVLFRSRRLGKDGHIFECLKFRTMTRRARVTGIGDWLRRFGLDELPQLLNVLKGEMSVVGPRPVLAGDADSTSVPQLRRFAMQPGLTGLWLVQEDRFPTFRGYLSADEHYRANWSVGLDLRIMLRSLGAALDGRGC